MQWKKDLTIETQFFDDPLSHIPDAFLLTPPEQHRYIKSGLSDEDPHVEAIYILERVLSNKVIDNFLHCWETLKQPAQPLSARADR